MQHGTWIVIESSPRLMTVFRAYRRLPESLRLFLRWLLMPRWNLAVAWVRQRASGAVLSGPFRGMRLTLTSLSERNLLGYVLGTQELELRESVEDIVAKGFPKIINIGAADGYYAVGFLCRMRETQVVAFEAAYSHHAGLRRAAATNHVADRLRVAGACDHQLLINELAAASDGSVLIFADIEGFEVELLDPEKIPALRAVDILVETHDAFVPNCTGRLVQRFGSSHFIKLINSRPRRLSDFPSDALPALARLMPGVAVGLMNERRMGDQAWLYLCAKHPFVGPKVRRTLQ
jgi:hypothetical protein